MKLVMKLALFIFGLIAFILSPSISSAQEAISPSGGNAEGTGGFLGAVMG